MEKSLNKPRQGKEGSTTRSVPVPVPIPVPIREASKSSQSVSQTETLVYFTLRTRGVSAPIKSLSLVYKDRMID